MKARQDAVRQTDRQAEAGAVGVFLVFERGDDEKEIGN